MPSPLDTERFGYIQSLRQIAKFRKDELCEDSQTLVEIADWLTELPRRQLAEDMQLQMAQAEHLGKAFDVIFGERR